MWAALLLACAPVLRVPGPLGGMGIEPDLGGLPAPASATPPPSASAVVATARALVGKGTLAVGGKQYRFDCSGLVEAALAGGGCPFAGSSAMLWDEALARGVTHRRPLPTPGDIAFFDDTYDRDGDGRLDDALSHVAVVEAVAGDGTITLIHASNTGVVRFSMNLRRPADGDDGKGRVLNDPLRARTGRDPAGTRYLAGELWRGFASFWRAAADR